MAWTNFLRESKKYMNHPDYWDKSRETDTGKKEFYPDRWTWKDARKAKIQFWKGFFPAACRFYWYCFRDWRYTSPRKNL